MRRSNLGSGRGMHDHQVFSAKVLPFPPGGRNNRRPSRLRYPTSLLPLGNRPVILANRVSQLRNGAKGSEKSLDGINGIGGLLCLHPADDAGDGLSRQVAPIIPVTTRKRPRTIRPMGRHSTPSKFKDEFAVRLRAARIAAGYETMKEFAEALGIQEERYKKWESGRTPIPHEFVPLTCELLDKDANYLFRVTPRAARKSA